MRRLLLAVLLLFAVPAYAINWTFTDNVTVNGEMIVKGAFPDVRWFPGATFGARLAACLAFLPSSGGTCDARRMPGALTAEADPFSGISKSVRVLLGHSTITTNAAWVLPNKSQIIGSGRGDDGTTGTVIKAGASFPDNTAIISAASGLTFALRVEDLTLDCDQRTGCVGFYSNGIQEQSGLRRVLVRDTPAYGIHLDGSGATGPGHYVLEDIEVNSTTALKGIYLQECGSGGTVRRVTVNRDGGASPSGEGIHVKNTSRTGGAHLYDIHGEYLTDGILLEGASIRAHAVGVLTTTTTTNTVHIDNTATNQIHLVNISRVGGTYTIRDDIHSLNLTNNVAEFVQSFSGSTTAIRYSQGAGNYFFKSGANGTKIEGGLIIGASGKNTDQMRWGITSVADGGTVSHSLGEVPDTVIVSGSVSGEMIAVTAKDASTFTVSIKTHSGAAGTTQSVNWIALCQ